jgi:hypothetical protein
MNTFSVQWEGELAILHIKLSYNQFLLLILGHRQQVTLMYTPYKQFTRLLFCSRLLLLNNPPNFWRLI